MIDVVVDQGPLGFSKGLFDRVKLLGEIETGSSFIEHFDDATEMALGPLQPLDDIRMGFMNVVVRHVQSVSPRGGYGNRCSCRTWRKLSSTASIRAAPPKSIKDLF